ncbi:hypothetical protein, partial [Sphingomonas sp.]|uniref:hypothetical protein n=1 Tax=Sphingomonas sp. TaxID=28214 RepID=UPI0025DCB7B3
RDLSLTACGNDELSFARNILAPLMQPHTGVYQELRGTIFGIRFGRELPHDRKQVSARLPDECRWAKIANVGSSRNLQFSLCAENGW